MKKNQTLRRILVLVISSVILSALVTQGVYSVISPRIYAQAKLSELYPRAQYLAEQASLHFASGETVETIQILGVDKRQWGASVFLFDINYAIMASTEEIDGLPSYPISIVDFDLLVQHVLAGNEQSYLSRMEEEIDGKRQGIDLLFIGIPIIANDSVIGAVIMLKSLDDTVASLSSLHSTLWFSAIAVAAAMLPFVYWFSKRITQPLREMRGVALQMAAGNFSIQADADEEGEFGDLARALNHLANELGNSVTELTRERNQAIAIVNALGEGILAVDAEGRPTQSNPALQTILSAAGGGRMQPLPQEVWEDYRTAIAENRCIDRQFLFGDVLLRLTITPIGDARTGVIGAIGVFHDETQAHRLEQTRRDYVANVSHELRTPLTALRAMIEPLRDGLIRTEERRLQTYDIILRETMRLSRLVDDMLELSRLQQGRLALEKIRFQIEPLLHDTASIYAAKAADTGHELWLDIVDKPLPTVLCNPDRTDQVLVALLNNAFTYTPPGTRILLRAEALEQYLRVTVEDNGPGIPSKDLPHVFERFYKADKSHGSGGTGLGLAIASELLQRLGEEIHVENVPEGGARFWFTLHYQ